MKHILIILTFVISSLSVVAKPPHLASEAFFDGRYNDEKSVTTLFTKSDGNYYRSLHINNNPGIVKEIEEAIKKDSPKAYKSFQQEGEGGRFTSLKINNNGETIDIGLQQYKGTAYFFIKGKNEAFK
ncbi:MAG: hypothetical protein K2J15_01335 [Muribaculaceae bacterium]|nr:hypothetical protein [Muribaculaceae bacterium]